MRKATPGESSKVVQRRVEEARARLSSRGTRASLESLTCNVAQEALTLLELGVEHLKMSARAYMKALRVAHTIAALAESNEVLPGPHRRGVAIPSLGSRTFLKVRASQPSTDRHHEGTPAYETTTQGRRYTLAEHRKAVRQGRHDAAGRPKSRTRAVHPDRLPLARRGTRLRRLPQRAESSRCSAPNRAARRRSPCMPSPNAKRWVASRRSSTRSTRSISTTRKTSA